MKKYLIFLLPFIFFAFPLDRIILDDNTKLVVKIIKQSEKEIVYQDGPDVKRVKKERVKSVKLDVDIDKYLKTALITDNVQKKIILLKKSMAKFTNVDLAKNLLQDVYLENSMVDEAVALNKGEKKYQLLFDSAHQSLLIRRVNNALKIAEKALKEEKVTDNPLLATRFMLIKLFSFIEQNDFKKADTLLKKIKKVRSSRINKAFRIFNQDFRFMHFKRSYELARKSFPEKKIVRSTIGQYYLRLTDMVPVAEVENTYPGFFSIRFNNQVSDNLRIEFYNRCSRELYKPVPAYLLNKNGLFFEVFLYWDKNELYLKSASLTREDFRKVSKGDKIFFQKHRFSQSKSYLSRLFLREKGGASSSARRLISQGERLRNNGEYWESIKFFIRVINGASDKNTKAEAHYKLARVFYDFSEEFNGYRNSLYDKVTSMSALKKITKNYPATSQWVKKAYLDLARHHADNRFAQNKIKTYLNRSGNFGNSYIQYVKNYLSSIPKGSTLLLNDDVMNNGLFFHLVRHQGVRSDLNLIDMNGQVDDYFYYPPLLNVWAQEALSQLKLMHLKKEVRMLYSLHEFKNEFSGKEILKKVKNYRKHTRGKSKNKHKWVMRSIRPLDALPTLKTTNRFSSLLYNNSFISKNRLLRSFAYDWTQQGFVFQLVHPFQDLKKEISKEKMMSDWLDYRSKQFSSLPRGLRYLTSDFYLKIARHYLKSKENVDIQMYLVNKAKAKKALQKGLTLSGDMLSSTKKLIELALNSVNDLSIVTEGLDSLTRHNVINYNLYYLAAGYYSDMYLKNASQPIYNYLAKKNAKKSMSLLKFKRSYLQGLAANTYKRTSKELRRIIGREDISSSLLAQTIENQKLKKWRLHPLSSEKHSDNAFVRLLKNRKIFLDIVAGGGGYGGGGVQFFFLKNRLSSGFKTIFSRTGTAVKSPSFLVNFNTYFLKTILRPYVGLLWYITSFEDSEILTEQNGAQAHAIGASFGGSIKFGRLNSRLYFDLAVYMDLNQIKTKAGNLFSLRPSIGLMF